MGGWTVQDFKAAGKADHVAENFFLLTLVPERLFIDIGLCQLVECLGEQRTGGDVLKAISFLEPT
jgi:hypothetical protein